MLNQPEFSDIQKVRPLLDIIEQEKDIYRLLRKQTRKTECGFRSGMKTNCAAWKTAA